MVVLAFLTNPDVIHKILKHLELPTASPPLLPDRGGVEKFEQCFDLFAADGGQHADHVGPCYPPAMQCPFCQPDPDRIVARNEFAIAVTDGFPVNPGHTLIVPLRHVASWFDATPEEQAALFALLAEVRAELDATLHPAGYNIGINVGAAAGQTVMHLHVHLIPRFDGDVDDPSGGVRFVIPSRGNYRRPGHVPQARE
jgi:diadenosine tetraphosphate (Ap4A) HIT family hydrolase